MVIYFMFNNIFLEKDKLAPYNACFALAGAIRETLERKNLPRNRFGISSTGLVVQKTLHFLFDFYRQKSKLYFQTDSSIKFFI